MGAAAEFYQQGLRIVPGELRGQAAKHPDFAHRLEGLAHWLVAHPDPDSAVMVEQMGCFFFPEGAGVLAPTAETLLDEADIDALRLVFGVDGRYGRHYTFLKAIGPLWQIVADDRVRATFKIDLDQVLPQPVLAA